MIWMLIEWLLVVPVVVFSILERWWIVGVTFILMVLSAIGAFITLW